MAMGIYVLLFLFLATSIVAFAVKYCQHSNRSNAEFDGQLHCLSGIILCNKPFFSFIMHCVGGLILLSNGLNVETDKELSLLMLAMLYVSLSGVINFDVRDHKRIHFASLFCVMVFSMVFVWLQCTPQAKTAYTVVSAVFFGLILFNFLLISACNR